MKNHWFIFAAVALALAGAVASAAVEDSPVSCFDPETFADPPKEFRPLRLVHGFDRRLEDRANLEGEEGIDRTLEYLVSLGIGGVVTNVGTDDYLVSDRQWEILRYGMRRAGEMGLALWLYDEKGYPSGTAGGIVTRSNPEYAAEGLACYTVHAEGPAQVVKTLPASCKAFEWACAFPTGTGPTGENVIDLGDKVDDWGTLRWDAPGGRWTVFYMARRLMYEGTFSTAVPIGHTPTRRYINTLDRDAVRAFLHVTHEQYARRLPPELWGQVQAVFTDEPLVCYHYTRNEAAERDPDDRMLDKPLFTDRPPAVPWSDGLADEFRRANGYDLRPHLFALFTSDTPAACYVRQDFWQVVAGLYADAYFGQIADWCEEHGTALSGHVLAEEGMWGHLMFEPDLFAIMRRMQIPGIDILTADPEAISNSVFIGAKSVSSVAHLTGRETVHCECCAFRPLPSGRKPGLEEFIAQANMLHVMGVNLFTLYQNQRQIGEEAFRQYTDYASRLSLMMRGGRHVCDVAVLYPVRSGWAYWTPNGRRPKPLPDTAETDRRFGQVANAYIRVTRELAQNQIDFDVVDERALRQAEVRDGAMHVADESYRVVVLPEPQALDLATAQDLAAFAAAGGTVISVDRRPHLADSASSQGAFDKLMDELFGPGGPAFAVSTSELPGQIRDLHNADLELAEPNRRVFYAHRRREERDLYFIVNNSGEPVELQPTLRVAGPYKVYRPRTGQVKDAPQPLRLDLDAYEGAFLVTTAR